MEENCREPEKMVRISCGGSELHRVEVAKKYEEDVVGREPLI